MSRRPRWAGALLVAIVLVAILASTSFAQGSKSGTDRATATRLALKALGAASHHGAEIVFALPSPISGGSDIRRAGPDTPGASGGVTKSGTPKVAHTGKSAWFFYEDLAPFQNYEHPGRVALVDVATGRVTLSGTFNWPPAINGSLPPFLANPVSYDSSRYQVFYRPYTGGSQMIPSAIAPLADKPRAALDPTGAKLAADALAAEHSCTVRFSDTLPGGYYGFGKYAQSRAGLYFRFQQLGQFNPGFHSALYSLDSGLSPAAFVNRQIATNGCRDVLLYMVGGGYPGQTAVNIGMQVEQGKVRHQDVTVAALRALIAAHPQVTFKLVIDSPHAAGFHALSNLGNVRLIATPDIPGGGSFTYVPNAKVGGRLVANDTNPLMLLQFTDRLAFGFDLTIKTPCDVTHAVDELKTGGSVLGYLLARGFAHGGPVDFAARAGIGSPPNVQALGFSAAAPQCHQPPVLAGVEASPLSVRAGEAAAPVSSTITVSDPDSAMLVGATVKIASGLAAGEDVLGFASQNGITGSYDATTGILTLTGSASVADYQTALRSVTYRDSNGTSPTAGDRTISFQVDDGHATNHLSNVASRDVTVRPYPAPVATPDSATTNEKTAIDIAVLNNDSDPNGNPLTIVALGTTGTKGSVSVNAGGTIHYDPNGQFNSLGEGQQATDTFTYTLSNGHTTSSPATVTVTITGVNDGPMLSGIESSAISYHAGTGAMPVTSTLAVSDVDSPNLVGATVRIASGLAPAEDQLGFSSQNGISGSYNAATGILTLSGSASVADYQLALRSVTYSDSNGSSPSTGTRSVSFQVDDGASSNHASNTVSRDISVLATQPPTANNDTAMTDKNTAIDIPVLTNDTDPQAYALHVASVDTTGTKGLATINPDGTVHYDPNGQFNSLNAGQSATDTFSYTANDGFHDSNSATVTVTINGVNDAPVLSAIETSPESVSAGETSTITGTLTASDVDNATLAGATVSISSGLVASEDALGFTDQNGITGSYDTSTGVLTLTGSASVANYQTALRSVTYRDSNGVSPTTGTRTVSFQVDDGEASNHASNVVSRDVVVGPNSPPVANPDSAATDENTAVDVAVLSNDTDAEGDPLHVASVDTTGTKGSVSVNPSGTVHYDPNGQFSSLGAGQTATDTFSYKANDGFHDSNSATVTVTITGPNGPPALAGIETTDLGYRAQDPATAITSTVTVTDPDDTNLASATVSIGTGFDSATDSLGFTNQNGITGSYNAATGVLTLTGSATLANYQAALRSVVYSSSSGSATPGSRIISFQVDDGHATNHASNVVQRQIDLTPANQPPVAGTNNFNNVVGNTTFAKGTSPTGPAAKVSGSLLDNATDPDSPHSALTVTGNGAPAHGTVTVNSDGTFTYLPAKGYTGADSFTYTISDNDPTNPKTTTGTVNLTIGPLVWYVDDSLVSAGDGRSTTPFNSLAAANSAVASGDTMFLYQGSGAYTGGTTMNSNEQLFGQPHGLTVNGFALVAAGGSNPVITNSGGDGIVLAAGADVEAVDVSNASGNGISGSSVGAATVGGGPIRTAITGSGADGIHIAGGSGTLQLGANVSTSTGHSVSISGRTGGTATLPGTISDTGTGITLSGNTGATINFTGALTASTGANSAFAATGGGTVSATGSGSTLTTTTARALDVENTTVGSSNLTFKSVSANGAANGITLSNTGTSGRVSVTGGGSSTQGGDASGGTIQNTTGAGIALSSTTGPSFNNMKIANTPNAPGVSGTAVTNFNFTHGTISGSGGTSHSAFDSNIAFNSNGTTIDNVDGTVTITNDNLSTAYQFGVDVLNNSGTLSDINVSNNVITSPTATTDSAGSGIRVQALGSGSSVASITKGELNGNSIQNFPNGAGIVVQGGNTSSSSAPAGSFGTSTASPVQIDNNLIRGQSAATPLSTNCILVTMPGRGSGFVDVSGNGTVANPLEFNRGNCVSINATGAYQLTATVNNNVVKPQSQNSGAFGIAGGTDKQVLADTTTADSAVLNLTANNNNVSSTTGVGMYFLANSQGTLNAKIQNNTVAAPTDSGIARPGIRVDSGTSAGTAVNTTVCANVSGNTAAGSNNGAGFQFDGVAFRKEGTSASTNRFGIVGLTPSPATDAQMQPYVEGQNPAETLGVGGGGALINTHGTTAVWTSCTLTF